MEFLYLLGATALSFIIVLFSVPAILNVARAKHLYEPFEERKIHQKLIPPLGGVAIFIGFLLSTIIASNKTGLNPVKFIIAAVTLMFFIGLKDDLVAISPRKKMIIQVWAALIITVLGDIRFTNLYGLFGIYEINYLFSLPVSLFTIIAITNAFNLIDGIDGLASGIGIVGTVLFGTWFYQAGFPDFAIICAALAGALFAFFLFNVFGNTNKLFMGDSGSLMTGVVLSVLVIQFVEGNGTAPTGLSFRSAPVIAFAVVVVPLIDTLRVMVIRILAGKSPFTADKNHIHHCLLRLFPGHLPATLSLVAATLFMVGFALLLDYSGLGRNIQFLIIFLTAIALSMIPSLLLRFKTADVQEEKQVVRYEQQTFNRVS